MTDDEYEALEERAAIIQFCSGREVSRTEAWRMACEQASQQAAKVMKAQQELASAPSGRRWPATAAGSG